MARNFIANLFIDIYLHPETTEKPCQWLENIVNNIFARKSFDNYCNIDLAKKEVTCKDSIDQEENPVFYVSLRYLEFNISGDYETDYDKLLERITLAIKKKLNKTVVTGRIELSGYDNIKVPDISAYALFGKVI
jgi:hypothetical protein